MLWAARSERFAGAKRLVDSGLLPCGRPARVVDFQRRILDVQPSVVDQDIDRAELLDNALPEQQRRFRIRQIGSEDAMPAAGKTLQALLSRIAVVAVMNRDARAALCKLHGDDSNRCRARRRHERHGRQVRARHLAPWRS